MKSAARKETEKIHHMTQEGGGGAEDIGIRTRGGDRRFLEMCVLEGAEVRSPAVLWER